MTRVSPRRTAVGLALIIGATFGGVAVSHSQGTVAEQRARLPEPASCDDPIAGVWQSHAHFPEQQYWVRRTLTIERLDGVLPEIEGTIMSHFWYGDADQSEPGPCLGVTHAEVETDARGTYDGERVVFNSVSPPRWVNVFCGYPGLYNPDNFSGEVDESIHEFQAVNNDGGWAVNRAEVFRRIDCLGDTPPVSLTVSAPPFFPESTGGCRR